MYAVMKVLLELLDDPSLVPPALTEKTRSAAVSDGIFTVYLGLSVSNDRLRGLMGLPHVFGLFDEPGALPAAHRLLLGHPDRGHPRRAQRRAGLREEDRLTADDRPGGPSPSALHRSEITYIHDPGGFP